MASNAWSARRSTIRRPPVCRSKPGEEEQANWPPIISVAVLWVQENGMDFNNMAEGALAFIRTSDGPGYTWAGANSQGDSIIAQITMAIAPGVGTIQWAVLSGPFVGELIDGFFTGWDGTAMWTSPPITLIGSMPGFTGECTLTIP